LLVIVTSATGLALGLDLSSPGTPALVGLGAAALVAMIGTSAAAAVLSRKAGRRIFGI